MKPLFEAVQRTRIEAKQAERPHWEQLNFKIIRNPRNRKNGRKDNKYLGRYDMKIFRNRVVLGILCIVLGLLAGFVILPSLANSAADTRPVVVMKTAGNGWYAGHCRYADHSGVTQKCLPGCSNEDG